MFSEELHEMNQIFTTVPHEWRAEMTDRDMIYFHTPTLITAICLNQL